MTSHSSVQDKWGFVLWVLRASHKRGVCLHQTNKQKSLRMFKVSSFSALSEAASESRSVVSDSLRPHGLYSPWNSLGQNTGVGSHSLPQGIFPTQESNPGLPHCRRTVYRLSHRWSPYIKTHNYVYIQICNWGTTDTEHYIRFRCTMLWFDICTYCEMITIGLPNTC